MKTKTFPGAVKAAGEPGTDDGTFEAIVSVFGNVDSVGDVVMPGAFTATLEEWAAKGDPIPVLWSHMSHDPDYHIGHVIEAKETEDGLWVKGQLDLDEPKSRKIFKLLKGRRVTQFSFAYDIEDGGWGKRDDREVYELRKLKLYEVGPTLIGANQETELLAAKGQTCPACGAPDSTKAKPAPADATVEPTPPQAAPDDAGAPNLSSADVLLSLRLAALAAEA